MMHIDEFIDDPRSDPYASWVFNHFRLPAMLRAKFEQFMQAHKLFCTYKRSRYRVTGASRLGDVWLAKDHHQEVDYDLRVDVAECSAWGPQP